MRHQAQEERLRSILDSIEEVVWEEQRVNVIADFTELPDPLGDGYRVEARIVVWEKPDALKSPPVPCFAAGRIGTCS